jgi:hypothetical protein
MFSLFIKLTEAKDSDAINKVSVKANRLVNGLLTLLVSDVTACTLVRPNTFSLICHCLSDSASLSRECCKNKDALSTFISLYNLASSAKSWNIVSP